MSYRSLGLIIIYYSSLDNHVLWNEYKRDTSVPIYADDVSLTIETNTEDELLTGLEEQGKNILRFFASNRLVANASKTAMVVFGGRRTEQFEISL